MFIAENINQFKKLFVDQLKNMLSADELGTFILVLANSQQDEFLKKELQADLETTFIALKNNFNAGNLKATQDDIDVFRQLLDVELQDIPSWLYKTVGVWEVAFNSIRQLRPARVSSQILNSIKMDYDETKFHFNKPFLTPEILWQGSYNDIKLLVLYNKFPFSDYHLLIALSPEKNRSQELTQETHLAIAYLAKSVDSSFPGFGAGFNSLAAGASVNHMHFQGFVREQIFPVENNCWKHNGGNIDYPLHVKRFDNAEQAWLCLSDLINQDIAYNCLYRSNICYVMPRKYQGSVKLPDWLMGAGWLDVAGVMTVSDKETFNAIDSRSIENALAMMSV